MKEKRRMEKATKSLCVSEAWTETDTKGERERVGEGRGWGRGEEGE
jgi:hypothetical protein